MKRRFKLWQVLLAAVLIFAIGRWLHLQIAYAAIEGLTQKHGAELSSVVSQSVADDPLSHTEGITSSLEYFKIFEYSDNQAE